MSRKIFMGIFIFTLLTVSIIFVLNMRHNNESYLNDDNVLRVSNQLQPDIGFSVELIFPEKNSQNYFVNYRIRREQLRQETKEMLKLILESDIKKNREEAQIRWLELSRKIEKETEIENMLKIKGFKDAVTEVNRNGVRVIVYAEKLTNKDINLIKKIIKDIAEIGYEKIQVSAKI